MTAGALASMRVKLVWPALCVARPTAASSSGLLVMASIRAVGLAVLQYQLH